MMGCLKHYCTYGDLDGMDLLHDVMCVHYDNDGNLSRMGLLHDGNVWAILVIMGTYINGIYVLHSGMFDILLHLWCIGGRCFVALCNARAITATMGT